MAWTNETKPDTVNSYLLKEDEFYLLLETGDKIIVKKAIDYTNNAKGSGSYTNNSKP